MAVTDDLQDSASIDGSITLRQVAALHNQIKQLAPCARQAQVWKQTCLFRAPTAAVRNSTVPVHSCSSPSHSSMTRKT